MTLLNTLLILYLTITPTSVGFLSSAFVNSSIVCQDSEYTYNYALNYKATYHFYKMDTTDNDCVITISGDGAIFPSERDILNIKL